MISAIKLALLAGAMAVAAPALAQNTGSSSANAASVQVSLGSIVKASAVIDPAQGTAPAAYNNSSTIPATANTYTLVPGLATAYELLNIGAATSQANSSSGALTYTSATTNLTNVSSTLETVLILASVGLGITADAISSTTTAGIDANGKLYSTGSSTLTNLGLTGSILSALNLNLATFANAAPNTVVASLAGLTLTLNEQQSAISGNTISAQTNAIDLSFNQYAYNGGVLNGNIILGHSEASISAVPEPAAWAMLIAGFGVLGVMLRRRRGHSTHRLFG